MGALACETTSETASHTPGNDALSGLPRYPSRKGAGSARGYTACCLQLAALGTRGFVLLAAGIDMDSGRTLSLESQWIAHVRRFPCCKDADRVLDIPSLPYQGKGRRRGDRPPFPSIGDFFTFERLSLVRGGLFSSLGKRPCVLLPHSGIGCRVVDGGRPIGEKGLVHAP